MEFLDNVSLVGSHEAFGLTSGSNEL